MRHDTRRLRPAIAVLVEELSISRHTAARLLKGGSIPGVIGAGKRLKADPGVIRDWVRCGGTCQQTAAALPPAA